MNHAFRKFLSISLVLCILVGSGIAQSRSAEHADHHAEHKAATHGTALCSWMCAAGTAIGTAVILIPAERSTVLLVPLPHVVNFSIELCRVSSSRAPPAFSL
ncbi:MAG TPA: hypothetical protein PKD12_11635 [Nitrospira sp.]|nr:hypothetical protein [Nitrospira sp.]